MDPQLPEFPAADTQEPVAFLDAVPANDLRNRRSAVGCAFPLRGGAISCRCKMQSIAAASSAEAEFLAAVAAAKHARCMRVVMTDLGFPPKGPAATHSVATTSQLPMRSTLVCALSALVTLMSNTSLHKIGRNQEQL